MKDKSESKGIILRLFIVFLKIGAFTFGGGYAMIALLENEFVDKRGILSKEEFLDMTAIAESTPGPVAINSATYIGYKTAGFFGALFSTVAVCIPSFVVIYIISLFLDKFLSLTYVRYAFAGIQVCVVYLVLSAGIKMLKNMQKTVFSVIITASVFVALTAFSVFSVKFSTVFYILICGFIGVFIYLIKLLENKYKGRQA